jgi:DNA ligase-1
VKRFADLYDALDGTTSTLAKVAAMVDYFSSAPPEDAAWALYFLTGRRLKRVLGSKQLWEWSLEATGLSSWLLEESFAAVGDAAETIALLVGRPPGAAEGDAENLPLSAWIRDRLLKLRELEPGSQRETVLAWWRQLPRRELYLLNKLMMGELRVGVSDTLVIRSVAERAGLPAPLISHRLMGTWEPSAQFFQNLVASSGPDVDSSRPYPFYLASPLEQPVEELGEPAQWLVEWKWDGIRGQLIRRAGESYLWSRGEELITHRFPELLAAAAQALPDGSVLDGEVLAYRGGEPLPFAVLQRRIGRQQLTRAILDEAPAVFMAFDLLEQDGKDIRELPLRERRARLLTLLSGAPEQLQGSRAVEATRWQELAALREEARERNVEGLMLKRWESTYRTGRKRGDWWKWKIDPYSVDAVLVYAHPGHGRRANLFTDYTFAVWNAGELLPIAKAYSGLSDAEIQTLDRWIRANTLERHGPVRVVRPVQVFELHFEAIGASSRHKSGIAVRFPRIARWRTDKNAAEADTLESVRALLRGGSPDY